MSGSAGGIAARLEAEREFHDRRFEDGDQRQDQLKYYWAVEEGSERFASLIAELAAGADVLEYGCGLGSRAAGLQPVVRSFHAIDISEAAIRQMRATTDAPNVSFSVMDAMNLDFADASFDLVYGSGIVHHLDTEAYAREVARVLRPGGTALFWEPLGNNPLINAYRALTPDARTPDEHPLVGRDFEIMRRHFQSLDLSLYGLTTLAAVPLRNGAAGRPLRRALIGLDRMLFAIPGVRAMAWYALIRCMR